MIPESRARQGIDLFLAQAGWDLCDYKQAFALFNTGTDDASQVLRCIVRT